MLTARIPQLSATVRKLARRCELARRRTLALTDFDEIELTRQHSPLMSPLVWDLAHIGQQEEHFLLQRAAVEEPRRAIPSSGPRSPRCTTPSRHPRASRIQLPLLDADTLAPPPARVRERVTRAADRR